MGWHRPLLLGVALIGGAAVPASAAEPSGATAPAAVHAATSATRLDLSVMRKWSQSCALCHVDGNGGAPRIGHPEEWRPRVAQGRDVLLEHTLDGIGNMPPLGYCMSCEAADFRALIDFMAGLPE
jgi:cytochrome c5